MQNLQRNFKTAAVSWGVCTERRTEKRQKETMRHALSYVLSQCTGIFSDVFSVFLHKNSYVLRLHLSSVLNKPQDSVKRNEDCQNFMQL